MNTSNNSNNGIIKSTESRQTVGGGDGSRQEEHLPKGHKGRSRQITEEVLGQPSGDFLTLAFVQDTWCKQPPKCTPSTRLRPPCGSE